MAGQAEVYADILPFAQRVKRDREAAGMTTTALAVAIGYTHGWVSQMESGQRKRPKVETVIAIAHALGQERDEYLALAGYEGVGSVRDSQVLTLRREDLEQMLARVAGQAASQAVSEAFDRLARPAPEHPVSRRTRRTPRA